MPEAFADHSQSPAADLFTGGGEMGARMRSYDWAATRLGPPEAWPQSLKTTIGIMLTSRYAMWMAWGPELTFFCNDAYEPTLGVKSTWALGAPSEQVWAEIWGDIGPRIRRVLETGTATWDEALLLFLERSGYPEETYHTFSYSPLRNDAGEIGGMLCVVTEETERVIGERRLGLLRDLAAGLSITKSEAEVALEAQRSLDTDDRDLPFTLTYLFERRRRDRAAGAARAACRPAIRPPRDDRGRRDLAVAGRGVCVAMAPPRCWLPISRRSASCRAAVGSIRRGRRCCARSRSRARTARPASW